MSEAVRANTPTQLETRGTRKEHYIKVASYFIFVVVMVTVGWAIAFFTGYISWPLPQPAEKGNVELAIAEFQKAIELEPNNADAYRYLSQAYKLAGQPEKAVEVYKQAIAADVTRTWVYLGLGDFYLAEGETEQAITVYRQALEVDPENSDIYLRLARLYRELEDYGQALQHAEQALKLANTTSTSGQVHLELGRIYQAQQRPAEALTEFLLAIQDDPNNAGLQATLGDFYYWQQNQPEQALRYYRRAVELAPDISGFYAALGETLLALGHQKESQEALRRALLLDPQNAQAHLGLARLFRQQKDYDQALQYAQQATIFSSQDNLTAQAHIEQGLIYQALQQKDEALSQFLQALEILPDHAWLHSAIGGVHRQFNQPEQALPYYRQAVALDPHQAWYYVALGQTLLALGDYPEAIKILETSLSLANDNPDIYLTLGRLAAEYHAWTQVIKIYEMALEQGIIRWDIYLELGDAYQALGQAELAKHHYQQAAKLAPDNPELQRRLLAIP